jgi:hypothetical protein
VTTRQGNLFERRDEEQWTQPGPLALHIRSSAGLESAASLADSTVNLAITEGETFALEWTFRSHLRSEASLLDHGQMTDSAEALTSSVLNLHLRGTRAMHFQFRIEQADPEGIVSNGSFGVRGADSGQPLITTTWNSKAEMINGSGIVDQDGLRIDLRLNASAVRNAWSSIPGSGPVMEGRAEIKLVLQLTHMEPDNRGEPPNPVLTAAAAEENHTRLTFDRLVAGKRYAIERSESLGTANWTHAHTFIADSNHAEWSEPWPDSSPALFYRLHQVD